MDLRKTLLSLGFTAYMLPQAAYGISLESSSQKMDRIAEEVVTLQEQLCSITLTAEDGTLGAKLAPASPLVNGEKWDLGIGFIYWATRVEGLEYAYTNDMLSASVPIQGDILSVKPDWSAGFQLFGSRFFEYDRWTLRAAFTFMRPDGSASTDSTMSSARIPTRGVLLSNTYVNKAKATYNLDYYDLDVDLGKDFYLSDSVTMHPYFGIVSLWLNQKLVTRYTGGETLGNDTVTLQEKTNMWGLGPQAGLSTGWLFGLGFSLTANLRAALPYGYINTSLNEARSRITTDRFSMRQQKHQFNPMLAGRIALGWSGYVNEKKQYIDVSFGYDFNYFFDYSEFITVTDVSAKRLQIGNGNISMQGIGLRASVSF